MFSNATQAVINTAELNQNPIREQIEAVLGSGSAKKYVSQIQLRHSANGFSSRSEAGQANLGMIGSVMRGQISNNARTRQVRLALPGLVSDPDLFKIKEERGRDIAETVYKHLTETCPDSPLTLRLELARAAAYAGIGGKNTTGAVQTAYTKAVKALEEALAKQASGAELGEEEQVLVNNPWSVIPGEVTVGVISVWDVIRICQLLKGGQSWCVRNKLLTDLSVNKLWDEVRHILSEKMPGLATACFGAMKADLPQATVFGGVSVNLAFTTGAAQMKPTLFTAVSDHATNVEHAGAEHLGIKELNSGVFCEPALYNIDQLRENLWYLTKEQFSEAVAAIYKAMALVTPSGGQRAHLTQSFPEFTVNVVSNLQPCSFESAFTKPIQGATEEGDMVESARQLVNHIQDFQCFLGSSSKDYAVIVLGTPSVMACLDIPADWIVVSSMDEMIAETNALTGV